VVDPVSPRGAVVALVVLSLVPFLPVGSGSGSPTFGPVVQVSSLGRAQTEASLALDPADPSTLFVCSPSGVPSIGYHQSWFYLSHDAGATWKYTVVENTLANGDTRAATYEGGDCDVAIDAAGTLYTADTWLGDLSVGHSEDGGRTWNGTALAVTSPIVDRPWLVAGPPGIVHLIHQDVQFAMPSVIWYTRSTDGGRTFQPSVPVTTATQDGAFTWEGPLVVAPDQQSLYVVYTRRPTAGVSTSLLPGEEVWVAASHDAGLTWTQHLVSTRPASASHLYPSLAMDAGGVLHVVFAQATADDQPIWYSSSSDQGASWSTPIKVLAGVYAFAPWVAGGPTAGSATIYWYGSSDPKASLNAVEPWFFYYGKVAGAGTPQQTLAAGTTTSSPVFDGQQNTTYEFSMVRTDPAGLGHVAAMAQRGASEVLDYQAQTG
jgi:hypothetical protein